MHSVIRFGKFLGLYIIIHTVIVGCVEFNERHDYKILQGTFTTPDDEYAFKNSRRRIKNNYYTPASATKYKTYVELDNLAVVISPIEYHLFTLYTWPHSMQVEFKKNTAYYETIDGTRYPLTFHPGYSSNTIRSDDSVSTGITRSGGRYDFDQSKAFYLPVGSTTELDTIIPPTEEPYRIYIPFELNGEVYEIDIVVQITKKVRMDLVSPVFTGNP